MGYDLPYYAFKRSISSYQRRFPVVYLTVKVMRRPRVVNKQHEVYAFYVSMYQQTEN